MNYADTKKQALTWYNKNRIKFKLLPLLEPTIDSKLLANELFVPALLTIFLERNLKKEALYVVDNFLPTQLKKELAEERDINSNYFKYKVLNYLNSHQIVRVYLSDPFENIFEYRGATHSLALKPFDYAKHRDNGLSSHSTTIENKVYILLYNDEDLQVNVYTNRVSIDKTEYGVSSQSNSGGQLFDTYNITHGSSVSTSMTTMGGALKYLLDNPQKDEVIDFLFENKSTWTILKDGMLTEQDAIKLFESLDDKSKYKLLYMTTVLKNIEAAKAFLLLNDINQFKQWADVRNATKTLTYTENSVELELPELDM